MAHVVEEPAEALAAFQSRFDGGVLDHILEQLLSQTTAAFLPQIGANKLVQTVPATCRSASSPTNGSEFIRMFVAQPGSVLSARGRSDGLRVIVPFLLRMEELVVTEQQGCRDKEADEGHLEGVKNRTIVHGYSVCS